MKTKSKLELIFFSVDCIKNPTTDLDIAIWQHKETKWRPSRYEESESFNELEVTHYLLKSRVSQSI